MIALTKITFKFAKDSILGEATCEAWLSPEDVKQLRNTIEDMHKKNKPKKNNE